MHSFSVLWRHLTFNFILEVYQPARPGSRAAGCMSGSGCLANIADPIARHLRQAFCVSNPLGFMNRISLPAQQAAFGGD